MSTPTYRVGAPPPAKTKPEFWATDTVIATRALELDGFVPVKPITPMWARPIPEPFTVHLLDGSVVEGQAGDYLVAEQSGRMWVIAKVEFDRSFTRDR